jgi:hypothetical protein
VPEIEATDKRTMEKSREGCRLVESQMEVSSTAVQGGEGREGSSGIHKKDRSRKNERHK